MAPRFDILACNYEGCPGADIERAVTVTNDTPMYCAYDRNVEIHRLVVVEHNVDEARVLEAGFTAADVRIAKGTYEEDVAKGKRRRWDEKGEL